MIEEQSSKTMITGKASLLAEAILSNFSELTCTKCRAVEWVVPLDEAFQANYLCDECE